MYLSFYVTHYIPLRSALIPTSIRLYLNVNDIRNTQKYQMICNLIRAAAVAVATVAFAKNP